MATKKTRLYEPWGYQEEENYEAAATQFENLLEKFFTSVEYDKETNKINFGNKDDEPVASLDVSEFVVSGSVIERAWYEDGYIKIKFSNGDIVEIDVHELIDEYTFKGGLQETSGVVTVKLDESTQQYISVTDNGIKIEGVDEAIDTKVQEEAERAISAETTLNEKIDNASSGLSEAIEGIIEKLGYQDNDTLVTTNEHEVAFGEYNISHTSEEASGQTIFSIGNGTSDDNRSNAVDVRKNGDVYLLIEGEMMNINLLLGQIAHEIY